MIKNRAKETMKKIIIWKKFLISYSLDELLPGPQVFVPAMFDCYQFVKLH